MKVQLVDFNPFNDHAGTTMSGTVTLTKPTGAREVLLQCQSGTARFTFGTVSPGTATGFQLRDGESPMLVAVPGTAIVIAPQSGTVVIAYQWGG